MTIAYIPFVNGLMLSTAKLLPEQLLTVTALVAGITASVMGIAANYPFALFFALS